MRVLIVGLNYAPEPIGIEPYTTGLAEHLAQRGHRVSGPRLARTLRAAERAVLWMADMVSSIKPQMVARLVDKGVSPRQTYELRNRAFTT